MTIIFDIFQAVIDEEYSAQRSKLGGKNCLKLITYVHFCVLNQRYYIVIISSPSVSLLNFITPNTLNYQFLSLPIILDPSYLLLISP
jgi:hypothetical protein